MPLRPLFVLIAGLVMLFVAPAVQAASFDCSKARTEFAKAICAHPDLSKADEDLAAAFSTALDGLSPPARAEVQGAQDAWVKFANIACTKNAKLARKPYDEDGISCLQSLFSDRTATLGNSKTIGGLRFYSIDRFAALADPDVRDDGITIATKLVSTPRIDGTDALAAAFNHYIETGIKDEIDPSIVTDVKAADGSEDDENALIVSAATDARITMTLSSYSYGHGAAHGNPGTSFLHFLRTPMRPLAASDVFAADGWEGRLQVLALAGVKEAMGDGLMLDDPTSINDPVIDPTRWDFSTDGLIIQFEPYEVAPYAAGAPTITIPWSKLDADFAPGAEAIVK